MRSMESAIYLRPSNSRILLAASAAASRKLSQVVVSDKSGDVINGLSLEVVIPISNIKIIGIMNTANTNARSDLFMSSLS